VLHEGPEPDFDPEGWRLRIWGEVETPLALSWAELNQEPQVELVRDWHCVTTWSRFDHRWGGVAVDPLIARARPLPSARHALIHCYDAIGYTTNLALEDLLGHDNLLCTQAEGQPLSREHGGPIRLVVHHLYAWKSAKWVSGIELLSEDQRGYWEERGYHKRADPWLEERYSYQEGEE
jgi:DMSO/TMAO reductase YedYZ molybdopterin-dependent catalytic subunit